MKTTRLNRKSFKKQSIHWWLVAFLGVMVSSSLPLQASIQDFVAQVTEQAKSQEAEVSRFLEHIGEAQHSPSQKEQVAQFLEKIAHDQPLQTNHDIESLIAGKSCKSCAGGRVNVDQAQVKNPGSSTQVIGSQIVVFASFALSDAALKAYATELAKVNGRLVMRGLIDDSFQITKQKLDQLGIAVDIDPPLFDDFKVTQVPVIVHAAQENGQYRMQESDRMTGQVTLKYALERFAQEGDLAVPQSWLGHVRGF